MSMEPVNPDFIAASVARSNRWHPGGLTDWSLNDWLCATGGELGEAMNAAKKLRRIEDGIANLNDEPGRQLAEGEAARAKIGEELADVLCYLVLTAERAGVDLNAHAVAKFNAVSERYGFPERLR